jgi:hypothetical protein
LSVVPFDTATTALSRAFATNRFFPASGFRPRISAFRSLTSNACRWPLAAGLTVVERLLELTANMASANSVINVANAVNGRFTIVFPLFRGSELHSLGAGARLVVMLAIGV